MSQPELSIVIPFLNEEDVLRLLRERLGAIQNRLPTWELLFVRDGSTDGSTKFIEAWAQTVSSVKLIVLTRNFGHQNAVSAGLSFASGKYVGIMDADLQDEPEVLLEMYELLLREKVDVGYCVRARFSTLVIILLFSNGLVFLYLGIPGEYVGQMFMEVKARPSFIIERTINIEKDEGLDGQH